MSWQLSCGFSIVSLYIYSIRFPYLASFSSLIALILHENLLKTQFVYWRVFLLLFIVYFVSLRSFSSLLVFQCLCFQFCLVFFVALITRKMCSFLEKWLTQTKLTETIKRKLLPFLFGFSNSNEFSFQLLSCNRNNFYHRKRNKYPCSDVIQFPTENHERWTMNNEK